MVQLSMAQSKSNIGDSRWSIGIGLDIFDQYTPTEDGLQTFKSPFDLGQRIWAWANINSSVAVEMGLGTTAIQTRRDGDTKFEVKNQHLLNLEGGLVYKFNNGYIMKENFPIAPFVYVKAKGSYITVDGGIQGNKWGLGIPVGGGINWRIADDIALNTQVNYTFGVTDHFENALNWTVGVMFDLGKAKVIEEVIEIEVEPEVVDTDGDGVIDENDDCPNVAGLPEFSGCPDSDGDGIVDKDDACPDVAGLAKFDGCPDTDGDGIADANDDCPEVPGIAALKGCPNPDADGDGINDDVDKCPKVPGVAALNGCPDADGDGITDSEDKCPTEAGTAENKGCPAVKEEVIQQLEFAAKSIKFETGSAVIKTESFAELDKIVTILKEWKDYSVKVSGYTDSVGSEESNLTLSQKRAAAAANYLTTKGIAADRVSSVGYGEANPIASNATAAGRKENRRVEFELFVK